MQIKIDYDKLDIPDFEGILVDKKNYNLRQSKKFIKKLLTYDCDYLKEGNFNEDIYNQDLMIKCWNNYSDYVFITTLKNRKLRRVYHNA